jgi:hypothetical protein
VPLLDIPISKEISDFLYSDNFPFEIDSFLQNSQASQNSSQTEYFLLEGFIQFRDGNANYHPARNIVVLLISDSLTLSRGVVTDTNGFFSQTFGFDLNLFPLIFTPVIYLSNSDFSVEINNNTYFQCLDPIEVYPQSYYYISSTNPKSYETNDVYFNHALNIYEALLLGFEYIRTLDSSANLHFLKASYNATGKTNYSNFYKKIYISLDDRFNFDAILHEFGHFISHQYNFDSSPGLDHFIHENLIDTYGAKKGQRMAWSEGFADYFSVKAQVALNSVNLQISNCGDTFFWGYNLNNSLSYRNIFGEGNELTVACLLWDLADEAGVDYDQLSYGGQYIFDICRNNHPKTFLQFLSNFNENSINMAEKWGLLFNYYNLSPITENEISVSGETSFDSNDISFNWSSTSSTANYQFGNFILLIGDYQSGGLLLTKILDSLTYSPTAAEWNNIISFNSDTFYWVILAQYNSNFWGYSNFRYNSLLKTFNKPIISNTLSLVNNSNLLISNNTSYWYKFHASNTNIYNFYSLGAASTKIELFNVPVVNGFNQGLIASDDSSGIGNNFYISIPLIQNQIIYIRITGILYNPVENISIYTTHNNHSYSNYTGLIDSHHRQCSGCNFIETCPYVAHISSHNNYTHTYSCVCGFGFSQNHNSNCELCYGSIHNHIYIDHYEQFTSTYHFAYGICGDSILETHRFRLMTFAGPMCNCGLIEQTSGFLRVINQNDNNERPSEFSCIL